MGSAEAFEECELGVPEVCSKVTHGEEGSWGGREVAVKRTHVVAWSTRDIGVTGRRKATMD